MVKLKQLYNEIKIVKPSTQIKIGNKLVNKSTSIPSNQPNEVRTYKWEEGKNLLSSITRKNAERLFIEILGITPSWVKIESSPLTSNWKDRRNKELGKLPPRLSFYIYGEYNGEPIMIARRETAAHSAGQTKLYSKYTSGQLSHILKRLQVNNVTGKYIKGSKDYKHNYWQQRQKVPSDKENILKALKINV